MRRAELILSPLNGAKIKRIYGISMNSSQEKNLNYTTILSLGAVQCDQTRDFIVDISNASGGAPCISTELKYEMHTTCTYYNVGGSCFDGDSQILLHDNTLRKVCALKKGDQLKNMNGEGFATVVCILKSKTPSDFEWNENHTLSPCKNCW